MTYQNGHKTERAQAYARLVIFAPSDALDADFQEERRRKKNYARNLTAGTLCV